MAVTVTLTTAGQTRQDQCKRNSGSRADGSDGWGVSLGLL